MTPPLPDAQSSGVLHLAEVVAEFKPRMRGWLHTAIAPLVLVAGVLLVVLSPEGLPRLGSVVFAIYVQNFGAYNETFGALGGVIVLLTWLWLSAFIVLMGAEVDSEIERQDKAAGNAAPPVRAAKAVTPGQQ